MAWKPTDSIYKMAMSSFRRQRGQASTTASGAKNQNQLDYAQQLRPFSVENLTQGKREVYGDAAGRGMLDSSATGASVTDFLEEWNNQKDTLKRTRDKSNWNIGTTLDLTKQQIGDQEKQAYSDLLRRRAASRGLPS
jgi:hypothetical protein